MVVQQIDKGNFVVPVDEVVYVSHKENIIKDKVKFGKKRYRLRIQFFVKLQ